MTSFQASPSKYCNDIQPDYHSITMPFKRGLTANWQTSDSECMTSITSPLSDWLLDSTSLTKRLSAHCSQFEVKVLSQSHSQLSQQEQSLFNTNEIECREVLLLCDGVAQVYARTLMPSATLEHANKQLKTLGNSSLGEVLFNDPSMRRSTIDVCHFTQPSSLAMMSQQLLLPNAEIIWGRRSMFYLQDYPLSVVEFFLPDSLAYTKGLL